MYTMDHQICSAPNRAFRKIGVKSKMSAMSLIYDQRLSIFMGNSGNGPYVRQSALVGWGSDINCLNLRIFRQGLFHIGYAFSLRIQIGRLKSPNLYCMIGRLMAVSRHQDPTFVGSASGNSRQDPCRAAVYQIIGLLGAVEAGCSLLAFLYDPCSMMQVVKPFDLRNIQIPHFRQCSCPPFVSRHVKGVILRLTIFP